MNSLQSGSGGARKLNQNQLMKKQNPMSHCGGQSQPAERAEVVDEEND